MEISHVFLLHTMCINSSFNICKRLLNLEILVEDINYNYIIDFKFKVL